MGELKQLGRHKIVRVLGSGAMGVVYEAHDRKLHRKVAIKTITRSAMVEEVQAADFAEKFVREAQSVAQLNHPNVVAVYDFGEEGDIAYFVMELVQGHDLKHYLDGDEQFSLPDSLGYMIQLLSALDYAHSQGIVHCDIKPANILIDESGRLKLTDFVVARALARQDGMQAGIMAGTPFYASPEQILGDQITPRSDIFAAGIVFYQLLTWTKPFTGEDIFAIQHKIINEDHALPSTLNKSLPPVIDQIVSKALDKNPEQRYACASEFSGDIRRFLAMGAAQLADGIKPQDDENSIADSRAATENTMDSSGGSALEKYLAEQEVLDTMFDEQFARFVTVMVTDLHELATIAVKEGGAVVSILTQAQNDILLPAIKENNGVYVKSIGEGSLSYFENALDAVRAAARIQKEMDALNMSKKFTFPALIRIGMHSGKCVVKEMDIFGDAVNAACRFEVSADAGGILMSEDTYNALSGKSEIYCRFVKQVTLKGKQEPCNAYKAFWKPQEIELEKQGREALHRQEHNRPVRSSRMKLVWGVIAMIGIVLLLTVSSKFFGPEQTANGARSINDSAYPAGARDALR